jgi:hypothetical protein
MSDTSHKRLGRVLDQSRDQFKLDYLSTIERLYNVPSLFAWTIFNEGWGQFDSAIITDEVRKADSSRLLDSASGWYDKGCGDFLSDHIYFWAFLSLRNDHKRVLGLSECGGFSLKVDRHVYSKRSFGYRYYHSFGAYNDGVSRLYRKRVLANIRKQGLNMAIFTQLSDIEEEENGLVTYDRKIVKINIADMRSLNVLCYEYFYKLVSSLSGSKD